MSILTYPPPPPLSPPHLQLFFAHMLFLLSQYTLPSLLSLSLWVSPEIMVVWVQVGSFLTRAPSGELYLGLSNPPLPSLLLPLRPQHPAAILILLWVAAGTPRSRSMSHWLSVRSVRPGWLGEPDPAPPGWAEMVRKMWLRLRRKSPPAAPSPKLPFRRTMRVLADLAGRDLWLYSNWDRWVA